MEFMYEILSDVLPNQNSGAATTINCIVNEVNDCVFRKFFESLNKFWKFCLKFWKFLKIFESFQENVNKHFEKLNENYNFLLRFILIAGWGLGCSPFFAIVPRFRGKASPFPPPPLVYTVQRTVYNETFQFLIQCQ